MIVTCITKDINETDSLYSKNVFPNSYKNLTNRLTLGKKYQVYGLAFFPNDIFIYIQSDNSFCPDIYPIGLFEVEDHRMSKYFNFGFDEFTIERNKSGFIPIVAIRPIGEIRDFYSKCMDYDAIVLEAFNEIKMNVALEFKDGLINTNTHFLSLPENNYKCHSCSEVFNDLSANELAECPKCKQISIK